MLDAALDAVLGVVVAGVTAVVGSDVAVARSGSGRQTRGGRLGWGVVGRAGSMCRRFLGVCSWVAAEGAVLVAVVGGGSITTVLWVV